MRVLSVLQVRLCVVGLSGGVRDVFSGPQEEGLAPKTQTCREKMSEIARLRVARLSVL